MKTATQNTAKTVRDIITNRHIRKGQSTGITSDGAFWIADTGDRDNNLSCGGGDGIGESAEDVGWYINIRHYRNGEVRCYLSRETWHQNEGTRICKTRADDILDAVTIEEVIQLIRSHKIDNGYERSVVQLSDEGCDRLRKYLPELPESIPSPDENL
jgi:hypothetical protein